MTNLFISPIIYTNHHSAPTTIEGWHTLIGIFIVLNIIWAITLFMRLIKGNFKKAVMLDYSESFSFAILHIFMVAIWAVIFLFVAGNYISKLIF
jgi:hypothetical protein